MILHATIMVNYRIDRAKEDLETAHLLFEAGKYRIANNRA